MSLETLKVRDTHGDEVELTLVCGDENEGIAHAEPDPWNRGQAFELARGTAYRKREGATWDCPSGGQWIVGMNGDDEEWEEVDEAE